MLDGCLYCVVRYLSLAVDYPLWDVVTAGSNPHFKALRRLYHKVA